MVYHTFVYLFTFFFLFDSFFRSLSLEVYLAFLSFFTMNLFFFFIRNFRRLIFLSRTRHAVLHTFVFSLFFQQPCAASGGWLLLLLLLMLYGSVLMWRDFTLDLLCHLHCFCLYPWAFAIECPLSIQTYDIVNVVDINDNDDDDMVRIPKSY